VCSSDLDERFAFAITDRMEASIIPFQNYSSIIIWSAGNEGGYGIAVETALKRGRELDQTRPLHYEAYHYRDMNREYDDQYIDMYSRCTLLYKKLMSCTLPMVLTVRLYYVNISMLWGTAQAKLKSTTII